MLIYLKFLILIPTPIPCAPIVVNITLQYFPYIVTAVLAISFILPCRYKTHLVSILHRRVHRRKTGRDRLEIRFPLVTCLRAIVYSRLVATNTNRAVE